ncbi:hypothetical protein DK37_22035 [Halomonas sp. SUBG004]|nr:hypothetical protein DK37_22035 [Halomonas sp. SUBG004]
MLCQKRGFSKKNRFRDTLLTFYVEKKDYFLILIASAELLVTAHDRSQAGATINAAVLFLVLKVVFEKKIFLYRESHMQNPMWSRLSDMSIQCVEFTDFLKSSTVNELPSKEDSMVEKR